MENAADRLDFLIAWTLAWKQDEQDRSRPSAVGRLLWTQWEAFEKDLSHGVSPPDKATVGRLRVVYEQNLEINRDTWNTRNALSDLQRHAEASPSSPLAQRLKVVLLSVGCWPDIPSAGQQPPDLRPYSRYADQLNKAVEYGQVQVLRQLLDWPNSGRAAQEILRNHSTGAGRPVGFLQSQGTGWSWAVANLSGPGLEALLAAGADPNAVDKVGRPGLAYANKPDSLKALLEAGADPLDPALPYAIRCKNLHGLGEGWLHKLIWEARRTPAEREWGEGVGYLRRRLANWPAAEAHAAGARLAFEAYRVQWTEGSVSPVSSWWQDMARDLVGRPQLLPQDEVEWNGHRWSFAAALARHFLLGYSSRCPSKLPQLRFDRLVAVDVPERTVVELANLPLHAQGAVAVLRRNGPTAIEGALRLLLKDARESSESLVGTLLHQRIQSFLGHFDTLGACWSKAACAVVQELFESHSQQKTNGHSQSLATHRVGLEWLLNHGQAVPIEQQGAWLLQAFACSPDLNGSSSTELCVRIQKRLVELAVAGWIPNQLEKIGRSDWDMAIYRHPELAPAVLAGQETHRLTARVVKPHPERDVRQGPRL